MTKAVATPAPPTSSWGRGSDPAVAPVDHPPRPRAPPPRAAARRTVPPQHPSGQLRRPGVGSGLAVQRSDRAADSLKAQERPGSRTRVKQSHIREGGGAKWPSMRLKLTLQVERGRHTGMSVLRKADDAAHDRDRRAGLDHGGERVVACAGAAGGRWRGRGPGGVAGSRARGRRRSCAHGAAEAETARCAARNSRVVQRRGACVGAASGATVAGCAFGKSVQVSFPRPGRWRPSRGAAGRASPTSASTGECRS